MARGRTDAYISKINLPSIWGAVNIAFVQNACFGIFAPGKVSVLHNPASECEGEDQIRQSPGRKNCFAVFVVKKGIA
jgi:hypothetical protein